MRALKIALVSLVVVIVVAIGGAIVVLLNTDFNQYRGVIAEKVKETTGRTLRLNGELKVVLGLSPSIEIADVAFANAPWGSRPNLLEAKKFALQVDLLPLIGGDIRIRRLVAEDADILLETDPRGRGNWEFEALSAAPAQPAAPAQSSSSSGSGFRLQVNAIDIVGALLVYHDAPSRKTTRFSLGHAKITAANDNSAPTIDINGTYNKLYFELTGSTGTAQQLNTPGTPFPVDLKVKLGATDATLRAVGRFTDALSAKGYDLTLTAETAELAQVADFIRDAGVDTPTLPKLGPLKAELRVTDAAPGGMPAIPSLKVDAGTPRLAKIKLDGAVRDPVALKGIALNFSAEGEEIGAFSGFAAPPALAPLPAIPALGPFKLSGKAANGPGDRISIPEFKLDAGRPETVQAVLDGAIRDPLEQRGIAVNVAFTSRDLNALKLGPAPEGPFAFQGKLEDRGADRYAVTGVKIETGGSDLAGDATLSLAGVRPAVGANLSAAMIDVEKLIPKGGAAAPASSSGPSAPGGARPAPSDGRVFSADPLPLDLMSLADAELNLKATTIKLPGGALMHASALQTNLRNGDLVVRPINTELGGGKIAGEMSLAGGSGALAVKLTARGVDLGKIDEEIPGDNLVNGGKTDADIDLKATGKTVRALMASLDGNVFLSVGQGTFKSRYTDMLGLGGLTDAVAKTLPRQETTQHNCTIARFDAARGLVTSRVLLADTARLTLDGSGTVDLAAERPSMLLNTRTKVVSLLSLVPPIRVSGTLADPSFIPDLASGAGGAVTGALGGVLNLPGNVLGGLTGQRQTEDVCAVALARATGRPAPAATPQAAPTQQQRPPAQQQQQTAPNPIEDLSRGLRNLFGR